MSENSSATLTNHFLIKETIDSKERYLKNKQMISDAIISILRRKGFTNVKIRDLGLPEMRPEIFIEVNLNQIEVKIDNKKLKM